MAWRTSVVGGRARAYALGAPGGVARAARMDRGRGGEGARGEVHRRTEEVHVLLILGIILLIIAIAGGVIVHPIIFALAIVAIVLFFMGR
jgi:uncharacterized membrane protein